MKAISWNVNGIRACINKGFIDYLKNESPDIIGIQETKGRQDQVDEKYIAEIQSLGYEIYWNHAQRAGYSGTAVLSKITPLSHSHGIDKESFDFESVEYVDETLIGNEEGRVTTLEFEDYYFVTVYTPNSKRSLERLGYRYNVWDKAFLQFLKYLESKKPVIICGDLNVAHKEIDLARPKDNKRNAGFTDEERERMSDFVDNGLVDTFRHLYPDTPDAYSWWSYLGGARFRNVGWRIDYFLVSEILTPKLSNAFIRSEVMGSDHCPVGIEIKI